MPKRKNADSAKAPTVPTRFSPRFSSKPAAASLPPKVAKKAAPKKVAKGKKANPENGDAKAEAPKVEAAADAK